MDDGAVGEVEVSAEAVALAGLEPVHYREGFGFTTRERLSAEAWARRILEGSSWSQRAKMLAAWRLLGVGLAPLKAPGQVLGWRIQRSDPEVVVLAVRAAAGCSVRLVLRAEPGRVTHAMLVRYDTVLGRLVWTRFAPAHRRFYVDLLDRARRAGHEPLPS
ncbi:hypothetical protein [Paractinoplanes atraurantiacus]|uniref:DUF2867 domain-containing protein n=1 Tax=Paractinoplanes atraurantiacus TaxID=1036182 RepID=A0A285H758_9ACTN|nr:hypothetical protein [Actinoplanes atraurantiacus]SNY31454.1 hypothetical protein SAMN05421748_103562 [Actinoplanes atraurantiacus]